MLIQGIEFNVITFQTQREFIFNEILKNILKFNAFLIRLNYSKTKYSKLIVIITRIILVTVNFKAIKGGLLETIIKF